MQPVKEPSQTSLPQPTSRRSFLRYASLAAALPILGEPHLALAARQAAARSKGRASSLDFGPGGMPADAVLINANENPMGPCEEARNAIAAMAAQGGRYDLTGEAEKLVGTFASQHGLKEDCIALYAGSSEPLHYTVLAFTSPHRGYVTADPGYEAGMRAAAFSGARISKVPLTATYAHDVKAMLAADPNAGVFYVCNPNNPTGTATNRQDILWLLENKPKGSILLVDEAYIHLSDEPDVLDTVAAGKDLIVLRTFSKVYGMAGIRCGLAAGRPDLLARLQAYGQNPMPITACAAANVSLQQADLVPKRKKIIADTRRETLAWLKSNGYKVIGDPQTNCFMIDVGRSGRSVLLAMQEKHVYIGRSWPVWPNAVRVTVGTPAEMERFRTAFKQVMDASPVAVAETEPLVLRTPFA